MLAIVIGLYLLLIGLLNIPSIQSKVANLVANELATLLDTELKVGRIDLGLFNRIIIEDFYVKDQNKQDLLKVSRLSARFDIQALLEGKISINSVQLFGFDLKLRKQTPEDKLNMQFIIDALSTPEEDKKSNIDLRINSLLIRRGKMTYDVASEPYTENKFNPNHVNINNIVGNISLKALQNDSINANIKRLSLTEASGVDIQKLSLKVVANRKKMRIDNIKLELPKTELSAKSINLEYQDIVSFSQFADRVDFSFNTLPSYFTLSDFSAFVPAFKNFHEKIDLGIEVTGTLNQLQLKKLYLNGNNHLMVNGSGSLTDLTNPELTFAYANLSKFYADQEGINFLVRNFSENPETPPILKRLGYFNFTGELSGFIREFVTYGIFKTEIGSFRTDVKFTNSAQKNQIDYKGSLYTKQFDLGKLSGNSKLGKISFDINVTGQKLEARNYPHILVDGTISEFSYNNYNYENITIDALYNNGGFDGSFHLNDENAEINLMGSFNLASYVPTFNFIANLKNIKPYNLHLTDKDEEANFSVNVDANFSGGSIDELNGEINVNNLSFTSTRQDYALNNLNIRAERTDHINTLAIDSEFLKAQINGKYTYKTIYNSLVNTCKHYLPALTSEIKTNKKSENNFSFDIDLIDTNLLTKMLNIPFQTYAHSTLKGYINDIDQKVYVEGYFPKFRYDNKFFESGMLLIENPNDILKAQVRLTQKKKKSSVNFAVEATAQNDSLNANLFWGNNDGITYSGKLNTKTLFARASKKRNSYLNLDIDILPSDVILNDTIWNIHPSKVTVKEDYIAVDNFLFTNDKQFVHIDGKVSESAQDSLKIDLNDVNLGYVFEIANIDDVDFKGKTTGEAYASQLFGKEAILNTNLHVANFTFNDGPMGDMDIYGMWDNNNNGIFLDADISQNETDGTHVTGYIFPVAEKPGLDLRIEADGTNIKFLEGYMEGIASNVTGKAYGAVRLHGPFKALDLEGDLRADAFLKIDVLNTSFGVNDSLRFTNTGIEFNNIKIKDTEGHNGTLEGKLYYKHFKDLSYNFDIKSNNMLVINTKETPDFPLYGKIFASGTTILSGNNEGLNVTASVSSGPKSQFTYITSGISSAASNQFIQFNDKTIYRNSGGNYVLDLDEEMEKHIVVKEEDSEPIDIRLNLQIEGTPDLGVKIIIDPIAGDNITAKGSGNIRTEFYNKGDVKMFGTYRISNGMYKFSLQEVIRKNFIIKDGSSITFNGDPMDAVLDIQAQYTVNSVSLSDLLPTDNVLQSQPHIKVNCIMHVTGQISNPDLSFSLELPNERDDIQTLVKNYISTEEQLNMQVLYLLGIGKFYTTDNNAESSDMMSSVLSSTLSGQLNDMLSQIINNNNWSFGTNVSTGTKGWTDVEVEGMLSGQLLNNRLLVNGHFGYRDNPYANSNFIGDFEAELLLNRSGNIRLKAYSRTNDRYLFRTNLTTQGVGIMFRKDFMNWKEFLFWNNIRAKRKALKQRKEQENRQTDSKQKEDN